MFIDESGEATGEAFPGLSMVVDVNVDVDVDVDVGVGVDVVGCFGVGTFEVTLTGLADSFRSAGRFLLSLSPSPSPCIFSTCGVS